MTDLDQYCNNLHDWTRGGDDEHIQIITAIAYKIHIAHFDKDGKRVYP